MIRVNLLKSAGATATAAGSSDISMTSSSSPEAQKLAGMKLAVIFGAIAALYLYNMLSVGAQQDRLRTIRAETARIEEAKIALGPTTPLVEKYESEKKTIESQLDTLRALARDRLREVKALDAIQSMMTEKTWLREIRIQSGVLTMSGYSLTDDGITELIRTLDSSSFFSDLIVRSTSEERIENVLVKRFDVEFKIGARNE